MSSFLSDERYLSVSPSVAVVAKEHNSLLGEDFLGVISSFFASEKAICYQDIDVAHGMNSATEMMSVVYQRIRSMAIESEVSPN